MGNPLLNVPRSQLAAALNGDHQVIRAFEELSEDTANVLPSTIEEVRQIASSAQDSYALGVFSRPAQPPSTRGEKGVIAKPDAAGPVLSVDTAYVVAQISSDASLIIAGKVFGKH